MKKILLTVFGFLLSSGITFSQIELSPEEQEVVQKTEELSELLKNGDELDRYSEMLDDRYSRWVIGELTVSKKDEWLEQLNEWFNDGWKIASRERQLVEVEIEEQFGYIRRIVEENYIGPDELPSSSISALDEIWTNDEGEWKLYRVTVLPIR